jgi:hypothetical protein
MSKPTPPSSSAGPSSTHDSLVEALLRTRTRTLPVRDSTDAASRGELLDHPLESDGARVTRALADQIEVVVRLAVGIGNAHLALEGIGPPEVRRKVVNVKEEEKGEDEDNGKEDGKEKEKEEGEDKEKPKQVKFQIDQDGADTAAAAITGPAGAAADDNADPDSSFADLEQRQEGIEAIMAKVSRPFDTN